MVTTDHAVPLQPYGGTAVVQNTGDTLYYADSQPVSATSNQGSIPGGGTVPFTSPLWVKSAGLSAVRVMSTPTVQWPINIFSRSRLLLANSFNAHSGTAIYASDFLFNPQDGFFYILYCDTFGYGLARATGPTGPWTDQGYLPGVPVYTGVPQCRLILAGNKWSFYYITTTTGGVPGLYQTAALGAINSTYTLTNAALLTVGAGFDANRVSEVFVFDDTATNGVWRMLYMGMNAGVTAEQIGMATATAPEGPWTKVGTTPIIANGGAGAFDNGIVSDPIVFKNNGTYYILYCAGGPNSVTGAATTSLALATTTDWSVFTKRGIVLPQPTIGSLTGPLSVPGDASATGWNGQLWWPGRQAFDNSCLLPNNATIIYYSHYGRRDSAAATGNKTQSYQATFDPNSIYTGRAIAGTPWTRVEAESGDAKLTTTGAWTTTTTGSTWNRGWSGTGFIFSVTANDFQMLSWTGTRARVCLGEAANTGIMNILLDGAQVSTFDGCYDNGNELAANPATVMAYDTGDLIPGAHTLKVQVSGNKNAASSGIGVDIDYWEYI